MNDQRTACIEWDEDLDGMGTLFVCVDNEARPSVFVPWNEPITSHTDSAEVAQAVASHMGLNVVSVEHDDTYIHAVLI